MVDIKGFEGEYAVTSCGRVWSYKSKRFLNPYPNSDGYYYVKLSNDGITKQFRVNRLVALAYIPNPEGLPHAGHEDDCKEHNYVSNLYWTNYLENNNHGAHNQRLSQAKKKPVVCVETGEVFDSIEAAAAAINRAATNICACLKGKQKTCGGFHWRFVEAPSCEQ